MIEPPTRILMLSYHFRPSWEVAARRVGAFAEAVANRGGTVDVVSAFGGNGSFATEIASGVRAWPVAKPRVVVKDALETAARVKGWFRRGETDAALEASASSPLGRKGAMRRFRLGQRVQTWTTAVDIDEGWSWRAARIAAQIGADFQADVIVSSGPPMSCLVAAAWVASRLQVPCVLDLRDPWATPQSRVRRGAFDLLGLSPWLERRTLSAAATVTCTTDRLSQELLQCYPHLEGRVVVIANGFDGPLQPTSTKTDGELRLLFAGDLYDHRSPFPILDALDVLLNEGADPARIKFRLITQNRMFCGSSLSAAVSKHRCGECVEILPPASPEEVRRMSAAATLLVNLAQDQPFQVPAKTFEHLAAGREALVLCEDSSATASVVDRVRNVVRVDARDSQRLLSALRDIYRRHVIDGVLHPPEESDVRAFSRARQNERFAEAVAAASLARAPAGDGCG